MSTEEVKALSRKMDRILFILDNDDDTGSKGLVARLDDLKSQFHDFVAQYNIDKAIKKGGDTVWKIVWGAVGGTLVLIGKHLIGLIF